MARLLQPPRAIVAAVVHEGSDTVGDALAHHDKPDIFNTDRGSQFTGSAFAGVLGGQTTGDNFSRSL